MENEEIKSTSSKKKTNIGFTLFACIMTGVIVFLATNLGQKAAKVVDPETKSTKSNTEEKIESSSNVESTEASNVTSNAETSVTKEMTTEEKYAIYSKNKQAEIAKMYDNHKEGDPDFSGYIYDEKEKIRINYKGEVEIYQPASKKYTKIFTGALNCGMLPVGNSGINYVIWVIDNNGDVYLKEVEISDENADITFNLEKSNKYKNIVYGELIGSSGGRTIKFTDIDGNAYNYQ